MQTHIIILENVVTSNIILQNYLINCLRPCVSSTSIIRRKIFIYHSTAQSLMLVNCPISSNPTRLFHPTKSSKITYVFTIVCNPGIPKTGIPGSRPIYWYRNPGSEPFLIPVLGTGVFLVFWSTNFMKNVFGFKLE
jgi:hypothetical protein